MESAQNAMAQQRVPLLKTRALKRGFKRLRGPGGGYWYVCPSPRPSLVIETTHSLTFDLVGKFVKAIIKNREKLLGAQIFGAAGYYTPSQILAEYGEATGKKTRFVQVSNEQYKKFLPEPIAEEMLENHLFIEDPGYYNGASLDESVGMLEEKPTSWKDFVAKTFVQ